MVERSCRAVFLTAQAGIVSTYKGKEYINKMPA
jgi:hypothetical protein